MVKRFSTVRDTQRGSQSYMKKKKGSREIEVTRRRRGGIKSGESSLASPSSSGDQVIGQRTLPKCSASHRLPGPRRSVSWVRSYISGVPRLSSGDLISGCDPSDGCQLSRIPGRLETTEELAQTPRDTQALGPYGEPKALEIPGPSPLAKDVKNMLTPANQQSPNLGPPRAPPTPPAQPQRRPRKQSNPQRSTEKVDPLFEGVTLKFHIKPDSSLQIIPSYSLACSSRSPEPPAPGPARGPEANPGGSEALAPRRCASCRTERTPLWRDAEDGTPLCNTCGIRYKKYGTRCSSCWLVPRKNVQPKKLCGRCGVSLGPHSASAQEG
ncbi:GATA-type zinc finger protein 1-like [Odocoileus virginianus]|uniref:GATA-type zinc finger protein 1-like n=1 Tax=Odocoileus virginianus TaxID=9874 RepID=A0ABM4I633_ODOVR